MVKGSRTVKDNRMKELDMFAPVDITTVLPQTRPGEIRYGRGLLWHLHRHNHSPGIANVISPVLS